MAVIGTAAAAADAALALAAIAADAMLMLCYAVVAVSAIQRRAVAQSKRLPQPSCALPP
jgi:hypothetical protein